MNYEIQNLTRRLVSIHCNSGKTCHLPPGGKYEVPEQEISENPAVKKLMARKLIRTREVSSSSSATSTPKKSAKAGAKSTKANASKKASAKKSSE